MGAGRPLKFNRDHALKKAIDVFWRRGYAATSVQDLLDAMGINRGSMYNTFGDKQSLFLQAVEQYCSESREAVSAELKGQGSALEAVRRVVHGWGETALEGLTRGCFVTNTAVELSPHMKPVADTLTYHFSRLERMIRNALDRAVDSGELPHGVDTRAAARFLVTTNQGLMVMGRTGAGREAIEDVVGVAMAMLGAGS
jgi:TetR/AcrR family transcriptional repressor of nem operon